MMATSYVYSPYESEELALPEVPPSDAQRPQWCRFDIAGRSAMICTQYHRSRRSVESKPPYLHQLPPSSARRRRRWQTEQPSSSSSSARSRRFPSFPPWDLYRECLSIFQRVIFGQCSGFRRFRGGGRCGAFRHGLQRDLTLVSRPSLAIYPHCTAPLLLAPPCTRTDNQREDGRSCSLLGRLRANPRARRRLTWKSNASPRSSKPIPMYALFPPSPSTRRTKYREESRTGSMAVHGDAYVTDAKSSPEVVSWSEHAD